MKVSRYTKAYSYEDGLLVLYSILSTAVALVEEDVWERINDDTLSPAEKGTLSEQGFLVDNPDEEKNNVWQFLENINKSDSLLRVVSVMNLDCNLSCVYCFEGGIKGNLYMNHETADSLVDFIERRLTPNKKIVHIDFYGGEPLLSLNLIKYISKKVQSISQRKNVGYRFSLVTNGTLLTDKTVDELIPLGLVGAKITLDGPRTNHDVHRPFKTGKGSFDLIIDNILNVCEKMKISIGGNFGRENYRTFPELLDYLMHKGLTPDKIATVKFDPIASMKSDSPATDFRDGCMTINEPWLMESSVLLREEILKRGFNTPQIEPSLCVVYGNSNFVINYDGDMYKCPAFIGRKEFCIGTLKNGNSDSSASYNLDSWRNRECMDCEYLPLCFGGCRYMKLLRGESLEGVDCKKQYLDATLEKFVKQDIKYSL